jgi:Neuraminidase (sialidase)
MNNRRDAHTPRSHFHLGLTTVVLASTLGVAVPQEALLLRELASERVVVAQGSYFPRLVVTRDGGLIAAFKTGAAHVGKRGRASIATSRDGGRSWSAPRVVFDVPDADDGIDASGVLADGTIVFGAVSYTWDGERYSTNGWKASSHVLTSRDGGATWSAPVRVDAAPFAWAYPFGTILELDDRTLVMAGYGGDLPYKTDGPQAAFVVRSRDRGKSWGEAAVIARDFNETSLVALRGGKLMAVMRARAGGLATSVSTDAGLHWSPPVAVTLEREHPGDLLRLRSGALLLTFGERNKPFGVQAMISRDEGKTWNRKDRVVLAWDGDHGDLGYPVTVQRPDGKLVTVYYVVYGERDSEGLKGIAPGNAFTKLVLWDDPWK